MAQQILSTNTFTVAKIIVSADATQGSHTTVQAAITAASSGDTIFVRDGTYTETLTLKAGITITALLGDESEPNVTIIGTSTFTAAGTVCISGIRLQTPSTPAALLVVSGSAASIVNLNNCYLNCSANTGITFSTSSGSAAINVISCQGNLGTTGIGIFAHTSGGVLTFNNSDFTNTGASTTANTCSAGVLNVYRTSFTNPITLSSTGQGTFESLDMDCATLNVTAFIANGGATQSFKWCRFEGGTGSAFSTTSATAILEFCDFNSSNTNCITTSSTGTITLGLNEFTGSSSLINASVTVTQLKTTIGSPVYGLVPVANGGTNATSFATSNGIVKYNGTSLVTSSAATLNANNVLSNTAQPCFLATLSSAQSNVTGDGTKYTIKCDNVVFDQASNYATGTGAFTAPVAGRYLFTGQVTLTGLGAGHTLGIVRFGATAADYFGLRANYGAMRDSGNALCSIGSCIINLAANDTVLLEIDVDNSTKTVTVFGQAFASGVTTAFSGHLIC